MSEVKGTSPSMMKHHISVSTENPLTDVRSNTNAKVQANRSKISKIDVSGKSSRDRFIKKACRYLNFVKLVGGFFNAHTIMTGASKNWDPERLQKGKHSLLAKVGAEHVQLKSKTGCKVDGHFLSAASFSQKLEEMGGKKLIFELEVKGSSLYTGKKCHLEIDEEFPVEMMEITLDEKQQAKNKFGILPVEGQISKAIGEEIKIVQDSKTKKFYVIDPISSSKLLRQGIKNFDGMLVKGTIKELDQKKSLLPQKLDFPLVKFDKKSSQWEEVVKMLSDMKIDKTTWCIEETDDAVYLVPSKHSEKLKMGLENNNGCSLNERPASLSSKERGAVLLTMNQSDIYEQYSHEMLTFMLEGVDVMAYNNPGKGLSTGSADRENINASIEASYQYLKSRGISDEKILAKGQCFGGAPTAWLSKKHPNINVMLDQNPANFHEVAMQKVNSIAEELMREDRDDFSKWIGKMLKDNFIINGIARALFGGYDVSSDIAHNKGHKLLNINTPNAQGSGGDLLVPKHHPEAMIDAMQDNSDKIITLSMNPGGSHVTDWWARYESREAVLKFLSETGLSQPLFE